MIKYLKTRLRKIISSIVIEEIVTIKNNKKTYLQHAIFNPEKVRIDDEAIISNNRSEIAKISIGDNSWIKGELLTFKHGGEIIIGEFSFIGPNSKIWSAKKITIGNRVLISHNVNIHDNNSHPLNSLERHNDFKHILKIGLQDNVNLMESEIEIGDDCWLGFNVTIMKGVKIGKGAIIGACTLVTENVPDFAVVVGNPPKIIKYVD